jgi:hypothetical protein
VSPEPAFIRHVCQAKAAELAGENPAAIAHIEWATQLATEQDDVLQLATWRTRLESVPTPPTPQARKPKCLSQSDASPAKKSPSTRKT